MGKITIFSYNGCVDSERAILALKKYSIPFVNIDIFQYPERQRDMISLTNSLNTPQIFINERHIKGGTDELITLLQKWDEEATWGGYETPLERYKMEIENNTTLPTTDDPRLVNVSKTSNNATSRQLTEEYISKIAISRNLIILPNGMMFPKGDVMRQLLSALPSKQQKMRINNKVESHHDCCLGTDVIDTLMKLFSSIENESDAMLFGDELVKCGMLSLLWANYDTNTTSSKNNDNSNRLNKNSVYTLCPLNNPHHLLNNLFVWSSNINEKPHPIQTILKLSKLMDDIILVSSKTSNSDDGDIYSHSLYQNFQDAVCQLQIMSFDSSKDSNNDNFDSNESRLAFGINLYNIMIRHYILEIQRNSSSSLRSEHQRRRTSLASVPLLWPTNDKEISTFLSNICYNVGGKVINAYELSQDLIMLSNREYFCRRREQRQRAQSTGGWRGCTKRIYNNICGNKGRNGIVFDDVDNNKDKERRTPANNTNTDDITNNRAAPATTADVFDPRIFFTMSLATTNSPLVRTYHPKSIYDEMQLSAQEYCKRCIKIEESTGIVTLPRLFKWYNKWKNDFMYIGNNNNKRRLSNINGHDLMASLLVNYMSTSQLEILEEISKKKRIKIRYERFHWQLCLSPSSSSPNKTRTAASLMLVPPSSSYHHDEHHDENQQHQLLLPGSSEVTVAPSSVDNTQNQSLCKSTCSSSGVTELKMVPMHTHITISRRNEEMYDEYSALKPPIRLPRDQSRRLLLGGFAGVYHHHQATIASTTTQTSSSSSSSSSSSNCPPETTTLISVDDSSSSTAASSSDLSSTFSPSLSSNYLLGEDTQSTNTELREILANATDIMLNDDEYDIF